MKKYTKILGILLGITFYSVSFAQSQCGLKAPASCFASVKDNKQKFANNPPIHCIPNANNVYDGKKISLSAPVNTFIDNGTVESVITSQALQSIIKDYEKVEITKEVNGDENCNNTLLNDGLYGYCTEKAFNILLQELCTDRNQKANNEILKSKFNNNGLGIKGIVTDSKRNKLAGVTIYSPEIDKAIKNLSNEITTIKESAKKTSNAQNKSELETLAKKLEKILQDPEKETGLTKINGKYSLITDNSGSFEIHSMGLPIGNYTFEFDYSDKNNGSFETKKISKYLTSSSKKDIFDIGIIKMTYVCGKDGKFDADCLFPAWASESKNNESKRQEIQGIYGKNNDLDGGGDKTILLVIPNMIDIMLKFVSPIVVIMFIYAGVRFIYAGSEEEELTKAKDFFGYAAIGLAFIIMSYTLMKVLYFFLQGGV